MDKKVENEMYKHSYRELLFEDNQSHQRRVLLARNIKLSSESDIADQFRGKELQQSGQLQKSIIPLKKAAIINPRNESAQMDLAKGLFKLEKDNEAFSHIKKTLSLNPTSDCFHDLLIEMLEKKHRLEDFESFSKEIVNMIADQKSIPSFYFASAQALLNRGKSAQALLVCRKAMKNDPQMGYERHYLYAEVLQHQGLYEEALVQFEKVKESSISDREFSYFATKYEGRARTGAAYMNYCLGKVQKAKEELEYILERAHILETGLTPTHHFLVVYHIDEGKKPINDYKEHKLGGFFFPSEGEKWARFYEQDLKITQEILQRDDINEETRTFNAKKLKGLNALIPFLKERIAEEEFRQQYCW